jgi:hypothetical protein
VVSVESAGDLAKLSDEVGGAIANAMFWAFGGSPKQVHQQYNNHSFIPNIGMLAKHIRIAEVSAKEDKIVPPHFQQEIVEALQSRQYNVQMIEVDGDHGAPPSEIYARGLDYVMTGN